MHMEFRTKLWKRGNSFATTIPHIVLLNLDMSKKYKVVWEYDDRSGKWTVSLEEINSTKVDYQ